MKLYLVTSNENKLKEVRLILPAGFDVESIETIAPKKDIVEDSATFFGNSLKKIEAYKDLGVPLLADDSGLVIDSLGGFPGVNSARFMENSNYLTKMQIILDRMVNEENRAARFVCAALFYDPSNVVLVGVEGKVDGIIARKQSGENGFGYDPIFVPQGYSQTFGVLGDSVKKELSHRAKAFKKLFSLVYLYTGKK
ncbi:MAG TPA: non-canonical purine NTP pyrophosphatase [Mesotoga infera]|uniref:dITP/XTP pyrophosphatase n=1 Tax=Mesotoga infera TaxID=1236046 RepID=A0A101IA28_9BACT|nr:MAG: Xanthosine triphosphate pyrophosphatase [Mesotoga infera]KUK91279.1 MAG: Xanthosine triphosphate pyrophosphatase [Mesotoga infera]HCO69611.1 non-canonical purine NTP pyrophosphatase [Mesotoga infera]